MSHVRTLAAKFLTEAHKPVVIFGRKALEEGETLSSRWPSAYAALRFTESMQDVTAADITLAAGVLLQTAVRLREGERFVVVADEESRRSVSRLRTPVKRLAPS